MELSGCKFGMIILVVGYVECGKMVMWGCVLMHGVVVAQNQFVTQNQFAYGINNVETMWLIVRVLSF